MQQALTVAALLVQLAELSTLAWLHVPVLHFMASVLVEHLSQDVRCRRSKHTCSRASTCFGARHMQRIIRWPAACATPYTIASNGLYIPESMSRYYDTINPWSSNSEMPLAKAADAESSCEAAEQKRNASRPADLFWAGQLLPHDTISRVHLLVQRRAKAHVGAPGAVALAFNAGSRRGACCKVHAAGIQSRPWSSRIAS